MRTMMARGGRISARLVMGLAMAAVIGPALFVGGCDRGEGAGTGGGASTSSKALPAPDASYTTKGRVVALADPARRGSNLVIHHEEIPELVNAKGEKVGMPSHAMDFPWVTADVSGLAVGDVVEITFDVRWKMKDQRWVLTRVAKLPAETPLTLKGE